MPSYPPRHARPASRLNPDEPLPSPFLPACALAAALAVQDSARAHPDSAPVWRGIALPVVGYSETTGLQYGATAFRSRRAGSRTSSDAMYLARTARGHAKAYAQVDRWTADGGRQLRARVEYLSYPLPYFGIGGRSPDEAEEWYSAGVATWHLHAQQRLREGLYLHADYRLLHTRMRDVEPGGALAAGGLTGLEGGTVSEFRLGLTRDTRDDPGGPRSGTFARIQGGVASRALGSRHAFRRLTMDARHYAPLPGGWIAAWQFQLDAVGGSVPFDQLPMIGADSAVRGYHRGRFRDRSAATAQVELRTPYRRRAGIVVFAGGGTVGPSLADLLPGRWHPSAGAGLRYLLRPGERATARVDLGLGRGTVGVSVGLGEAF